MMYRSCRCMYCDCAVYLRSEILGAVCDECLEGLHYDPAFDD